MNEYTTVPSEETERDDPAEQTALAIHGGGAQRPAVTTPRRLNAGEQLQVAIWIVEGANGPTLHALMAEAGMPRITDSALTKYRHNDELLEAAKQYLRKEISTVYLGEKAVRIRQLQRHADRLAKLMNDMGLVERTTKITGYEKGGGPLTTEEEKFAHALSKEWRDTLEQLRKEVEPIERTIVPINQTNTTVIFNSLSESDQQQFAAAMAWMPQVMPRLVTEPIEGEAHEIDENDGGARP